MSDNFIIFVSPHFVVLSTLMGSMLSVNRSSTAAVVSMAAQRSGDQNSRHTVLSPSSGLACAHCHSLPFLLITVRSLPCFSHVVTSADGSGHLFSRMHPRSSGWCVWAQRARDSTPSKLSPGSPGNCSLLSLLVTQLSLSFPVFLSRTCQAWAAVSLSHWTCFWLPAFHSLPHAPSEH